MIMILTVSPHGMWGLKVKPEKKETIYEDTTYTIIYDEVFLNTTKNPNKCNEFINSDINNWIISNNFHIYKKYNPTKFSATLNSNSIIKITGRI